MKLDSLTQAKLMKVADELDLDYHDYIDEIAKIPLREGPYNSRYPLTEAQIRKVLKKYAKGEDVSQPQPNVLVFSNLPRQISLDDLEHVLQQELRRSRINGGRIRIDQRGEMINIVVTFRERRASYFTAIPMNTDGNGVSINTRTLTLRNVNVNVEGESGNEQDVIDVRKEASNFVDKYEQDRDVSERDRYEWRMLFVEAMDLLIQLSKVDDSIGDRAQHYIDTYAQFQDKSARDIDTPRWFQLFRGAVRELQNAISRR